MFHNIGRHLTRSERRVTARTGVNLVRRGVALAALAAVSMLGATVEAQAQPACAIKMTIRTGADNLRPNSNFSVHLIVRGTDARFPIQPDGNHRVFLHSSNNIWLGAEGMKAWSERTFYVGPSFGTADGSGCPRSQDVIGVGVQFHPDLDGWGWDQWDNAGITLTDSVNGLTYWRSTVNNRFKIEAPDWKTTNPVASAPWVRGF